MLRSTIIHSKMLRKRVQPAIFSENIININIISLVELYYVNYLHYKFL